MGRGERGVGRGEERGMGVREREWRGSQGGQRAEGREWGRAKSRGEGVEEGRGKRGGRGETRGWGGEGGRGEWGGGGERGERGEGVWRHSDNNHTDDSRLGDWEGGRGQRGDSHWGIFLKITVVIIIYMSRKVSHVFKRTVHSNRRVPILMFSRTLVRITLFKVSIGDTLKRLPTHATVKSLKPIEAVSKSNYHR